MESMKNIDGRIDLLNNMVKSYQNAATDTKNASPTDYKVNIMIFKAIFFIRKNKYYIL